jgi:anti-anti-sigma regulatory factor
MMTEVSRPLDVITKIDSISFDKYLTGKNPFEGSPAIFDLAGVEFISSSGLVQITAACHALAAAGKRARVLAPHAKIWDYLLRVGFFSALDGVAQVEPELPGILKRMSEYRRGSNPLLIEVTRINSGKALPDLLDQVVEVLRGRMKYKKYDAFDVATAVSELAQNCFDHNSGTCGFLAMQTYGTGRGRFLEIGVADHGDGIAATLRRNPKNRHIGSDIEAIRHAMQLGVSEHDDATRGTGLHHLIDITYKHSGSVQIRSGNGKVRFRMDRKQGWTFSVPTVPGVQVALTLPTKAA